MSDEGAVNCEEIAWTHRHVSEAAANKAAENINRRRIAVFDLLNRMLGLHVCLRVTVS